MKLAQEYDGLIIADLHAHPAREGMKLEQILDLLSWGVTGLAKSVSPKLLLYEDAVKLPGVKEIDPGLFAQLTYQGRTGYFAKIQEIITNHHILAVGCSQYIDYEPQKIDPRKAVELIHEQGGVAVLNHPFVTNGRFPRPYRLINEEELIIIRELCQMVDQVEVFNGQNINFLPFIGWFNAANEKARQLAAEYGFKGSASSDCHARFEQVKTSGIYLPREGLCTEAIKHNLKTGNFERHESYATRWSFFKGHLYFVKEHLEGMLRKSD